MRVADALVLLDAHQARIRAVLVRGRAAHANSGSGDAALLAQLRWEVLRLLREYQLFKHGELFDPLLRSADVGRRLRAATLKRQCEAMAATVHGHVRRWTLSGETGNGEYAAASGALMAQLEDHLTRERAGIVGLLEGIQRTRHA